MPLTIKVTIVALLIPFGAAAGSCMKDETSLMQMKSVVKHGTERSEDPVDEKAEVDSMPDNLDDGAVSSAYLANSDKVSAPIEEQAADDLEFGDKVTKERSQNAKAANDAIDAQNKELQDIVHEAKLDVQRAADKADEVMKQAEGTVDSARENYEAHAIKKSQAEDAAIIGSLAGQERGATTAANMKEDHDAKQTDDAENKKIAEEQADLDASAKADKDAINQDTAEQKEAYDAYVSKRAKETKEAAQKVEADASAAQTDIEGPEGLGNQVVTDSADSEANAYVREATKANNRVKAASQGAYPKGQWPEEPSLLQRPAKDSETADLLLEEAVEQDSNAARLLSDADVEKLVKDIEAKAVQEAEEELPRGLGIPPRIEDPEMEPALVKEKAILDSTPGGIDQGQVTSAWEANLAKEKDKVEFAAADSLKFKQKVHDQRIADSVATEAKLRRDRHDVSASLYADRDAIRAAFDHRIAVQKAAIRKMAAAKQGWEARLIKKRQAQNAAAAGRWQGAREGAEDAARGRQEFLDDLAATRAARNRAAEDIFEARRASAARAAALNAYDPLIADAQRVAAARHAALDAAAADRYAGYPYAAAPWY